MLALGCGWPEGTVFIAFVAVVVVVVSQWPHQSILFTVNSQEAVCSSLACQNQDFSSSLHDDTYTTTTSALMEDALVFFHAPLGVLNQADLVVGYGLVS